MKFSEFQKFRPKPGQNVFAFVCEDDFLVEESRTVWAGIFEGQWNFEKLNAKEFEEIEFGRLTEDALTPSLFSQSRAILVMNAGKLSKSRIEDLATLQGVVGSALKIILLSGDPKSAPAWTKAFPTVVIDSPRPADVARWLMDRYKVSADIARYVVESIGTDLYPLHNEMEKLKTYAGDRPIEIRDVDALVLRTERFGRFALDDTILARDYRKAIQVVGTMLDEGTEPLLVLSNIVRVWRQLFIGKGLAGKRSADEVAAAAGVPGFKASDFVSGCRKYEWKQLAGGFRELLAADRAFKSSLSNVEAYFDVMLWKLFSPHPGLFGPRGKDVRPEATR